MPGLCHYFIVDGNIQYCSDSKHQYAGQTRPLVALPLTGEGDLPPDEVDTFALY